MGVWLQLAAPSSCQSSAIIMDKKMLIKSTLDPACGYSCKINGKKLVPAGLKQVTCDILFVIGLRTIPPEKWGDHEINNNLVECVDFLSSISIQSQLGGLFLPNHTSYIIILFAGQEVCINLGKTFLFKSMCAIPMTDCYHWNHILTSLYSWG